MKKPGYPELARLMAAHGMTKGDISQIVGLSYRNTIKKINRDSTDKGTVALFDIIEAGKIAKHFQSLGENVTIEQIFLS